jgi:hypothetical protein
MPIAPDAAPAADAPVVLTACSVVDQVFATNFRGTSLLLPRGCNAG